MSKNRRRVSEPSACPYMLEGESADENAIWDSLTRPTLGSERG